MGKLKIPKKDTWIDMTPMSDVMILLLTFFMLTSTFLKPEPVTVAVPMSVSEVKIPETNILSILVSPDGQIFLDLDGKEARKETLEKMAANYKIDLTPSEINSFSIGTSFGVPMKHFKDFMALRDEERNKELPKYGVPMDSINNEFKGWVLAAKEVKGKDLRIAIKADAETPYPYVQKVMSSLQDIKENRYNLITSLRSEDE